ncbi:MAG: ABC transporter permease [Acidiferrobacterales bacterium]|nr:ABC transporter permease [Acidiferrobacterales bacterium]
MSLLRLGIKSLWSRRFTVGLIVLTIATSTILLLGVERVRQSARASFVSTVSGVDLVVGARSGAIPLLLYSVFRIGNATNNITWESYRDFADRPEVKWTIPLSLGDSHRGYRVVGTNADYFEFYQVGRKTKLEFSAGKRFDDIFEVVIGAEVAERLGYKLGQSIVISHGLGATSFADHDDKPFTVSGVLKPTGTPVDRSLHVSLEAIEAIHIGWEQGVKIPGAQRSMNRIRPGELEPKAITAFMIGLSNRIQVFKLQREINDYREEPLLAVLPGVALQELWGLMSVAEKALWTVSLFVAAAGFMGMIAVFLAGLNERRREIAVYRAVGANYRQIIFLLIVEAGVLTMIGILVGLFLLVLGLWLFQGLLETQFGLFLVLSLPSSTEVKMLFGLLVAGLVSGMVPAYIAYRNALVDGLTAKS